MARLLRPKKSVMRHIETVRQKIGLDSQEYIAIHIRRGDKVVQTAHTPGPPPGEFVPLSKYLDRAAHLRSVLNVQRLFVATDDTSVVAEAMSEGRAQGFTVCVDEEEERQQRHRALLTLNLSNPSAIIRSINSTVESMNAITNMFLLSESMALVCQWSSVFAKVAQFTRFGKILLGQINGAKAILDPEKLDRGYRVNGGFLSDLDPL